MHNTPFFSKKKKFRAKERDKHVYDIVADDYDTLLIIESEQIKFT